MRQFFHLFLTSSRWFVGTLVVFSVISFFLWRAIDPIGSADTINQCLQDLWEIAQTVIALALCYFVFRILFSKVFSTSGGKRKH